MADILQANGDGGIEVNLFQGTAAIPAELQFAAQKNWMNRPADQRFAELDVLSAAVHARRKQSVTEDVTLSDVRFLTAGDDIIASSKVLGTMRPTHWAFGQTASLVAAPAAYLRKLPVDLAVQCLNHGLSTRNDGMKLYGVDGDDSCELRAVTSQTYGRIWDADVVDAATKIVDAGEGRWFSPWAWSKQHRALFASDRDIFLFFVDGGSIVDGGGDRDQLHRGFFLWNSEVGSATFGLAAFLFRAVCGNFSIWDMQDARILKIRHTSGGPERFVSDAIPALRAYVETSTLPLEKQIRAAKALPLPTDDDDLFAFFTKRGFTRAEVKRAKQFAEAEEGQFATVWDAHNGFTAAARMLAYADAQVDLSRRAGKLIEVLV